MTGYYEQTAAVDALVKKMKPTRNGPISFEHLMKVVETTFKQHGWNFSAYVKWATENYYVRLAANKANKLGVNDTITPSN